MKMKHLLKGTSGNLLIGAGIALAAPLIWPIVAAAARPMAKTAVRGYLAVSDTVRHSVAETSERFSDLVAEVREERGEAVHAVHAENVAPKAAS